MNPLELAGPTSELAVVAVAALGAGFASSAHCALMCGPLACVAATRPSDETSQLLSLGKRMSDARREPKFAAILRRLRRARSLYAYHGARTAAYMLVGAALGALGEGARRSVAQLAPVLPWLMAAGLLASAFQLSKRLPVPAALKRLAGPIVRKSANFSPVARAAAIGASTPLLPCASLYSLFLTAVAVASVAGGAVVMGAFALGATPSLLLVQAHAPLVGRHPRAVAVARRVIPVMAAMVLVWRATHAGSAAVAPTCH